MLKNIEEQLSLRFHSQTLNLRILLLQRESIVLLAKLYRGTKGFIIIDLDDEDIIDNIDYAAVALDQPLTIRLDTEIRTLGPVLTKSNLRNSTNF